MRAKLEVGQEAPNFDLASTEDVVLMLRDEVPRTPVLLYFFGEVEPAESELRALGGISRELAGSGVKIMAVSAAKLEELKAVQNKLRLAFPLLHDDRNLSLAYREESEDEQSGIGVFVLVGRDQKVRWIGQAPLAAEAIRSEVAAARKVSSSVNYPRRVINRLVDLWVN